MGKSAAHVSNDESYERIECCVTADGPVGLPRHARRSRSILPELGIRASRAASAPGQAARLSHQSVALRLWLRRSYTAKRRSRSTNNYPAQRTVDRRPKDCDTDCRGANLPSTFAQQSAAQETERSFGTSR